MWRNWGDIEDSHQSVVEITKYFSDHQNRIVPHHGPGHWNDPDTVGSLMFALFPTRICSDVSSISSSLPRLAYPGQLWAELRSEQIAAGRLDRHGRTAAHIERSGEGTAGDKGAAAEQSHHKGEPRSARHSGKAGEDGQQDRGEDLEILQTHMESF